MKTFVIRPAVAGDSERVAALAATAYARYVPRMGRKHAPMLEDYAARIAAQQVHVLESLAGDGLCVRGFLVLEAGEETMLLDNVAVAPGMQGRGYGKALVDFAEKHAKAAGFAALYLYTNEAMVENIGLYTHLGFVETHRACEQGYNRVFMKKTLG